MASGAAALVAGIIDRIEGRPYRTGRPPLPTVEVVETLRFFVREGVQWREARAPGGRARGPPPRPRPAAGGGTALLPRGHFAPIRMGGAGAHAAPWDRVGRHCSARG